MAIGGSNAATVQREIDEEDPALPEVTRPVEREVSIMRQGGTCTGSCSCGGPCGAGGTKESPVAEADAHGSACTSEGSSHCKVIISPQLALRCLRSWACKIPLALKSLCNLPAQLHPVRQHVLL